MIHQFFPTADSKTGKIDRDAVIFLMQSTRNASVIVENRKQSGMMRSINVHCNIISAVPDFIRIQTGFPDSKVKNQLFRFPEDILTGRENEFKLMIRKMFMQSSGQGISRPAKIADNTCSDAHALQRSEHFFCTKCFLCIRDGIADNPFCFFYRN